MIEEVKNKYAEDRALSIVRACHVDPNDAQEPVYRYHQAEGAWDRYLIVVAGAVRVDFSYLHGLCHVTFWLGDRQFGLSGKTSDIEAALASLPDSLKVQP